jgi:UDP-N-acetylmuramate--alanine ligase
LKLENKHIIYFLGIGGIGMSALARWFMHLGKEIYGYDKTSTPLTRQLAAEGAVIHYDAAVASIPERVLDGKQDTLVVLTPAIPADHEELNYFKSKNYYILKRSEVLGLITEDLFSVAVAGTHGKTTTSSMIAHILKTAGRSSLALMGGILQGYESNLILEGPHSKDTIAVLEADEYDRSFLRLSPDIAVVTSADPDHLDIYGDLENMKSSFKEFINKTKVNGHVFVKDALTPWLITENPGVKMHSYALDRGGNMASNIDVSGTDFIFKYHGEQTDVEDVKLSIPGYHNVENAVVAISVALQLGIASKDIKNALASFKGIKRRFEYHILRDDLIYIDDYAHHPTEIRAFVKSVKDIYPEKKITLIFQPHLFTRTRDFADEFAKSLDLADEIILMDIYPAREKPMTGVTSELILNKMQNPNRKLIADQDLLHEIIKTEPEVLLTVGAGDIDRFVKPIKELLENR